MALPEGLGYFKVTWKALAGIADGADADDEPDIIPVGGEVVFAPAKDSLTLLSPSVSATLFLKPVVATVDVDGVLKSSSGMPYVSLIAPDSSGLTETGWTWQATFKVDGYAKQQFSFNAVAGAVYDLAELTPAQSDTGSITLRGPQGASFNNAPLYAGIRPGNFDPARSLYNFKESNTTRLRTQLAAAVAGIGLCRIGVIGDSLNAGYGASVIGVTDYWTRVVNELRGRGYQASALIHSFNNSGGDSRLVPGGTGWDNPDSIATLEFPWLMAVDNQSTYTLTGEGTVLDVVGTDQGGGFTVTVDGVHVGDFVPDPDTVGGARLVSFTGLAPGRHTAVIQATTSSSFLLAAGFRHETGVVIDNAAMGGATTQNWDTTYDFGPLRNLLNTKMPISDCVVIELQANDFFQNVDPAVSKTHLSNTIYTVQARNPGCTILLVVSNYPQGAEQTWVPYINNVYDMADRYDLPLLDLAAAWGTWESYNADGQYWDPMIDGIHMTDLGQAVKAEQFTQIIPVGNPQIYVDAIGTPAATPNTVVRRDGGGNSTLNTLAVDQPPSQPYHVTRKDYVDALGTPTNTADAVVKRDEVGNFIAGTIFLERGNGSDPNEAVRKDYVDGFVNGSIYNAIVDTDAKIHNIARDFNPSQGGAQRWVRILTVDGHGPYQGGHFNGIISGFGDYGNPNRGTAFFHIAQRSPDSIQVRVWSLGTEDVSGPPQFFTKQISTYVFELWVKLPAFNLGHTLTILNYSSATEITIQLDNISDVGPDGTLSAPYPIISLSKAATDVYPATAISAAPDRIGKLAVVGGVGYLSVGTASAADWKQITN